MHPDEYCAPAHLFKRYHKTLNPHRHSLGEITRHMISIVRANMTTAICILQPIPPRQIEAQNE